MKFPPKEVFIFLIVFCFLHSSNAQDKTNNFWKDVRFGGGFGLAPAAFDFAATASGEPDEILDNDQGLTSIGPGYFFPYKLADYRTRATPATIGLTPVGYLSPAYDGLSARTIQANIKLADLNNDEYGDDLETLMNLSPEKAYEELTSYLPESFKLKC